MLTLTQAQDIVAHALAAAREAKLKPMGIVVLDARGALIAAAVEDGNPIARWKVALGKAEGAIQIGVSSRTLGAMAIDRPHFFNGLTSVLAQGVLPVPGAVLIRDASGAVIGAAGASGDTSDNDEAILIKAITAVGLAV